MSNDIPLLSLYRLTGFISSMQCALQQVFKSTGHLVGKKRHIATYLFREINGNVFISFSKILNY